jgi:NAD dependent epimerase/dehydratase family enzyme
MKPGRFGFLVQTGKGHNYMPWIHINDLCNIYLKAIKDPEMNGTFNAVSPQHVTGKDFINTLARVMKLPVFPLPVPAIILKAALGEMSEIILRGSRVSSDKIINAGYRFWFSNLHDALTNIIQF